MSHWSARHGTELSPDWLGEEEAFIHIPLAPRELLWMQSAETYCLSPRVA